MVSLRARYEERDSVADFQGEEAQYRDLLPQLQADLRNNYNLGEPINIGSTATVWKVVDVRLQKERAIKVPRPREGKLTDSGFPLEADRTLLRVVGVGGVP